MDTQLPQNTHSRKMIEEIGIKMILQKIPDASKFVKLIKFVHEGERVSLDLRLLPQETATQIRLIFD
jgi:hypothetical protein